MASQENEHPTGSMRTTLEAVGIFPYEVALRPEPSITYFSAGLTSLLELDGDALLADPQILIDLMAPGQRERFNAGAEGLVELLEGPLELSLTISGGRTVILRQCGTLIRDEQGRPACIHGVVRDVTPLTQTLQALRESETRFESLLEASPFGVMLHRGTTVVAINDAARQLLGIPPEMPENDIVIERCLDPGEVHRIRRFRERRAAGLPAPNEYETKVALPDGSTRHILVGIQQVTHEGEPCTLACVVDITDRKRAEEELAASRLRFQSIVEMAPAGMFVQRDGVIVYANEACRRLVGARTPSVILGGNLLEQLEEIPRVPAKVEADEGRRAAQWRRYRTPNRNAPARFVEIALMEGEFAGLPAEFGIVRDVTTQVQFQRHLEDRIAFESLLCHVSAQFINARPEEIDEVIDQALEQIGIIARVDRCFLTLITPDLQTVTRGYAWAAEGIDPHHDIMQGDSLNDYPYAARCLLEDQLLYVPSVADLPPEAVPERALFEQQGVLSTVVLPLYSEGVWRGFFGMETTRKRVAWTDEHLNSLRLAAQVFSYAINRKHTEEELGNYALQMQTAQKMETLGVLAGGIAHDFNNLLTGILGNASVALQELPEDSTPRQCVAEIERAAQHAAQLVRQMLLYAGRGKSSKRRLDLNLLVEDIGHLLRTSIGKRAALHFELAQKPPMVEADETQLRQIVMNLITNAAQALEEKNGDIYLRTGTRAVGPGELRHAYLGSEAIEGIYAFVEVEDMGCGMPPEVVERMFDPFFTSKPNGTGLGLAATLGIVRAHRGIIELDTAVDRGTRFTVSLPLVTGGASAEAPDTEPESAPDNARAQKGHILVVDDEAVVRAVARRILERGGYTVVEATNGDEGVQVFREASGAIDGIVLDMAMPVMDGEQAFDIIRSVGPPVPVVFSSGYLVRETIDRLLQEPATAFVGKPYRPSHLIEVLAGLMGEVEESLNS